MSILINLIIFSFIAILSHSTRYERYLPDTYIITKNQTVNVSSVYVGDILEISFKLKLRQKCPDGWCWIFRIGSENERCPLININSMEQAINIYFSDSNDLKSMIQANPGETKLIDNEWHHLYMKLSSTQRIFKFDGIIYVNITNQSYDSSSYINKYYPLEIIPDNMYPTINGLIKDISIYSTDNTPVPTLKPLIPTEPPTLQTLEPTLWPTLPTTIPSWSPSSANPTTSHPTTYSPTMYSPTTSSSTTYSPTTNLTTSLPTSTSPTTNNPTTTNPTTANPTSSMPTSSNPTTSIPTTSLPSSSNPTTSEPTTISPTTTNPTTAIPTSLNPTSSEPTTSNPTTSTPTTTMPTTTNPTTAQPTKTPITADPTTSTPTTAIPTTYSPTTYSPTFGLYQSSTDTISDPTTTSHPTTSSTSTYSPSDTISHANISTSNNELVLSDDVGIEDMWGVMVIIIVAASLFVAALCILCYKGIKKKKQEQDVKRLSDINAASEMTKHEKKADNDNNEESSISAMSPDDIQVITVNTEDNKDKIEVIDSFETVGNEEGVYTKNVALDFILDDEQFMNDQQMEIS